VVVSSQPLRRGSCEQRGVVSRELCAPQIKHKLVGGEVLEAGRGE
jgi:hypothetical protein